MRRFALTLALFSTTFASSVTANAAAPQGSGKTFMVFAFNNASGQQSQHYLSIGLASVLADRLARTGFKVKNAPFGDPLLLTREQAATVRLDAANEVARRHGADYIIAGSFKGHPEHWELSVGVYRVTVEGALPHGKGEARGDQLEQKTNRKGKLLRPTVSTRKIHAMLATATSAAMREAFASAAQDPSLAVRIGKLKEEIEATDTADSYAFILWSRACAARLYGDADTAGDEARHALLVDPEFVEARRLHAASLVEGGRMKEARIHFQELLKRRKNDLRGLIGLGRLEMAENDAPAAVAALTKAVSVNQRIADVRYWLGMAHAKNGDAERAAASLVAARNLDPGHAAARELLGRLRAEAGNYDAAAAEYSAVAALEPERLDIAYALAAVLRANNKMNDAIAAYVRVSLVRRTESVPHKFRGDLLTVLGLSTAAREAYVQAHRLAPNDARLIAIVGNSRTMPVAGGGELLLAAKRATTASADLERFRKTARLAGNDIIETAASSATRECPSTWPRAYARATASAASFSTARTALLRETAILERSRSAGEWLALTPSETTAAKKAIEAAAASDRDAQEIEAQLNVAVRPLIASRGCATDGSGGKMMEVAELRARNDRRYVEPAPAPPPKSYNAISPRFPLLPARIVKFRVRNGTVKDRNVYVDDGFAGTVPSHTERTFTVPAGPHKICATPVGVKCGVRSWRKPIAGDRMVLDIKPGN